MRRILFIGPINFSYGALTDQLNSTEFSIHYTDTFQKTNSFSDDDILIYNPSRDIQPKHLLEINHPNIYLIQDETSNISPIANQLKTKIISAKLTPTEFLQTIAKKLNIPFFQILKATLNEDLSFKISIEIAKAKRSNSPLSFAFLPYSTHYAKITQEESVKLENQIKNEFRLSDEILPLSTGLLLTLFATTTDGVVHKIQNFFSQTNNSLSNNFDQFNYQIFTITNENKYTLDDLLKALNSQIPYKPASSENLLINKNICERLNKLFFEASTIKKIKTWKPSKEISHKLSISENPPTYLGGLIQLINDDASTKEELTNFLQSETNIYAEVLIHQNFIKNSTQENKILEIKNREELHQICYLASLENIFNHYFIDQSGVAQKEKNLLFTIAKDISISMNYPLITEVLLGLYLRAISKKIIETSSPTKYLSALQNYQPHHNSFEKCLKEEGLPSIKEVIIAIASSWSLDESIADSAACTYYDSEPQFNPQLTAILHLTEVVCSHQCPAKTNNLPFIKEACDEIRLKNRAFQFNYLPCLNLETQK